MTDTEREDMELAAKAAGMFVLFDPVHAVFRDCSGAHESKNFYSSKVWNPRADDGDSRRLQCVLKIDLIFSDEDVVAIYEYDSGNEKRGQAMFNNDPCAAAREAVFRVAVKIGRGMK